METVVFVSDYKKDKNLQDGMMQRIIHIDEKFENSHRIYLNLSFNKFKYDNRNVNKNVKVINANVLKNYREIKSILSKCNNVYIHSIYNFFRIIPYLNILKNKNITLDLHGAVPEELKMYDENIKYFMFKLIERIAFKRVDNFIFVNQVMQEYYEKKYANIKSKVKVVYPILTNDIIENTDIEEDVELEKFVGNTQNIFIYSGNTQKWQNINLMMQVIKSLSCHGDNKFIVLSKEREKFANMFIENKINPKKYIIRSVSPDKLAIYYNKAKFGFILRDDCILNRVANPTKMIEYLSYGIVPIVKLSSIGDFENLNYKFIRYNNLDEIEKYKNSYKCDKNMSIVKSIIDSSKQIDINKIVIRGK